MTGGEIEVGRWVRVLDGDFKGRKAHVIDVNPKEVLVEIFVRGSRSTRKPLILLAPDQIRLCRQPPTFVTLLRRR
jgi:hypothetical protein